MNDGTLDRSTIEAAPFDAVVTGLHRDFDYRAAAQCRALQSMSAPG